MALVADRLDGLHCLIFACANKKAVVVAATSLYSSTYYIVVDTLTPYKPILAVLGMARFLQHFLLESD